MKISTRFSFSKSFLAIVFLTVSTVFLKINAQAIPATDTQPARCHNCVPTGWFNLAGTPDVSDQVFVSVPTGDFGTGDVWNSAPLPLPPNNHTDWMTLRDAGTFTVEEEVGANMTGLITGQTYELFIYSMSSTSPNYSPQYINFFDYQVGGAPRVSVTPVTQETWGTTRIRFFAPGNTIAFRLFPGADMGSNLANLESVNFSISSSAINAVPVANNDYAETIENNAVTLNITNNDTDANGNIDLNTIYLDPSTPGFQTSFANADGSWVVNSSGDLTFTPSAGFFGVATRSYTVQDDYSLDGNNLPATSNEGNILIVVDPDSDNDGIDDYNYLDDDNDSIMDIYEENTGVCADYPNLVFNSATLESGTALNANAVYRFPNVTAGIDALVTIVSSSPNPAITTIDDDASNINNFQPVLAIGASEVEFNFQFVQSGTSTPTTIDQFYMTGIDIDGDGEQGREFYDLDINSIESYAIESQSDLSVVNNPSGPRFVGQLDAAPGIDITATNVQMTVRYFDRSDFSFTIGANPTSNVNRLFSINFDPCTFNLYTNPTDPNLLNQPIDTDGDGIEDRLDLDSDNDGIYDVDEAGNGSLDTNDDGVVDSNDAGFSDGNNNGADDTAEATIPVDTGGDGSYDFQNTDSDGDGCPDANEAYTNPNAAGSDDGQFGEPDPASVDSNGLVTETGVNYSLGTNNTVTDSSIFTGCLTIDAVNDDFSATPIDGTPGGTTATVFTNDTSNGVAASDANINDNITITNDGGLTGAVINTDGTIDVPSGAAAGTYTLTYQICLNAPNDSVCDTATVVIEVVAIDAVNDDFSATPIDGTPGGTTATVFTNDTSNGVAASDANINDNITITNDGGLTGAVINTDGTIDVPSGAAAGTYTLTYQICLNAPNDSVCDTATVVIEVVAIDAVNDDFSATPIDGTPGGTTATVFTNDTSNGVAASDANINDNITITNDGGLTGAVINTDGTIDVPSGAAAGTYTLTYQICLNAPNDSVCDTATVVIEVVAIDAVNDDFSATPIDGTPGGTTATVFTNDTSNGVAASDANINDNITITNDGGLTGAVINTDGTIDVPSGAAAGTYTLTYQICLNAPNDSVCDTATVVIEVVAIDAVNDDFSATPIDGTPGGTTATVFTNDTSNGVAASDANINDNITITNDGGLTGAVINTDGTIDVPSGAAAGTYTLTYQICLNAPNDSVCDTATVVIEVVAIDAVNDDFSATPIDGTPGGTTATVFTNDTSNGVAASDANINDNITITNDGGLTGAVINTDGTIDVPSGAAAGTYTLTYQICLNAPNDSVCDTATVVIEVVAIDAVNDDFSATPIDGTPGGTTATVFTNDTSNGVAASDANINDNITITNDGGLTGAVINTDGTIDVPSGAAAGTYTLTYQICLNAPNDSVCDTATVVIEVVAIDAVNDDFSATPIDGTPGGTTATVFTNDTSNGVAASDANINDNITITNDGGLTGAVINTDGTIDVPSGAAAGTYTLTYQICLNAPNDSVCDTATVVIEVVAIDAVNDDFSATPIDGTPGGTTATVFTNDTSNGVAASDANINDNITITNDGGLTGAVINTDGTIDVPSGAAAGTYTLTYQICLNAPNDSVCDTATVVIEVVAIDAVNDDFSATPIDGTPGGTTATVFTNDTSNGVAASDANINDNITITNDGGLTGAVINTDGTIDVPSGAAAGTYTLTYQICLNAPNDSVCDTATVVIEVVAIDAVNDDFSATPIDGTPGGTTATVFTNDTSNGVAASDANINDNITITNDGGLTGAVINTDGTIDVPSGAAAGTYTLTYQICLNAPNDSVCDTATVVIEVVAIDAVNDDFSATPIDGTPGGTTATVFTNDTSNGVAASDANINDNITITNDGGLTGAVINTDGTIDVPSGAAAGTYTLTYQICLNAPNDSVCDTATVVIEVVAIDAVNDDFSATPIDGTPGGTTATVFTNDTSNGVAASDANINDNITITNDGGLTGAVINTDGTIDVPSGAAAGTYTLTYQICLNAPNDSVCDTATVVIEVVAIDAVNDDFSATPIDGTPGGTTATVFTNDTSNGVAASDANINDNITITNDGGLTGAVINTDGTIDVPSGAAAGTYTLTYQICLNAPNDSVCDTATVVIEVVAIDAVNDDFSATPIDGTPGGTTATVFTNDTSNGVAASDANINDNITITNDGGLTGAVINTDGTIDVPSGAAAGTYTLTYQICLNAPNDSVCDTATVVIEVVAIDAVNDDFSATPIDGTPGGTTATVFTNDTSNGVAASDANINDNITITNDGGLTGAVINTDGTIDVPSGAAAGTYTLTYQICLNAPNDSVCDTATVVIEVVAIDAVNDDFSATPIDGTPGGTTATVFTNDTSNGVAASDANINDNITITNDGGLTGAVINTDGTIDVPSGAAAGTYTLTYQICLNAPNDSVCDTATVVIEVVAIDAVNDDFSATPIDGTPGGTTATVFTNDTSNGVAASDANINDNITITNDGGLTGAVINTDGTIDVPSGAAAGTYTLTYQICLNAPNDSVCDTATVVIEVVAIDAVNDDFSATPIDGTPGGTTATVFTNDTSNGVAASDANINDNITITNDGGLTGAVINTDGTIDVPSGAAAGTYTLTYQICLNAPNDSVCDTATVVIEVVAIDAVNDDFSATPIDGTPGGTTATVFTNDTSNGVAASDANINDNITITNDGGLTGAVINTDGTIDVPSGAAAGTYTLTYQICLNAPNDSVCDTATVVIEVVAIDAVNDDFSATPIDGTPGGTTATVFTNDTSNGVAASDANINDNITITNDGGLTGAVINTDGTIDVPSGAAAGTYTLTYQICLNAPNDSVCDTATVVIEVELSPLAVDDSSLGNTTGSSVVVDVLSNDSDPDGTLDPSTVQIVGTSNPGDPLVVPGEGTWTVNTSTGEITFTPEVGFTADPTPIDYTVNDNDGNTSNTATVTVGYDAQPPLAVDDSSLGNTTGSPVVVDVLSNDSDPDGTLDPSTVQIVGTSNPGDPLVVPGEGTWTVNTSTGEITFTPEVGFTADPTPIDYTVNDNDGNTSNTATVTVGYDAQPPLAVDDSSLGNTTGSSVVVDVLSNDSDPDGTLDPSTVQIVGTSNPGDPLVVPGEGTWTVNTSTGDITFTPEIGFTADPTPIDYTVNDNDGNTSNTATVTVGYDAQPPLAVDDSSLGNTTGSSVVVDVLSNDSDPDGTLDPSTVQIVGTSNPGDPLVVPGEGTWTVNTSTGEITFTPEVGFTADPTPIDYTVNDNDGNTSNTATVTVGYDAQPPLAVDDSSLGNTTGSSVVVDVLSNDSDPDGTLDPSTVQIVGTSNPGDPLVVPGEGTWTVNTSTGEITFTPEVGFTADPTPIDYTVNDNDGNTSNTATVTVGYDAQLPLAVDDSSLGNTTGSPVVVDVLSNDSDPDGTLDPSTVQIVGTSNPGDPLVVPGEGTWTVNTSTGEITFTPEVGFTADPTPIDYTVNDNDGNTSNTATVTVGYDAQPPLAVDDSSLGNTTGSPVVVDVLSNDSDPDGTLDPSTVQIVGTSNPGDPLVVPGEGTWTVNTSTGEITFTPEVGFTADPTPIDYTVNDNDGNTSNTATVTVGYDAQPPLAVDDSSLGNTTGSPVVVDVLSNDSDPDGTLDPSTVQIVGTSNPGDPLVVPGEGTWTVNTSTGEITFTPEVGFTADPTPIDYTVNDNDGNTSNTATVTVGYDAQPPLAVDDSSLGNTTGSSVVVDVLSNDSDPDGTLDPSTVQIVGTSNPGDPLVVPGEGTWTVNTSTGDITFTPEIGFTADPTPIDYTVNDNDGNTSNTATVTVGYDAQPPLAVDDSSLGNTTGSSVVVDVLSNDSDPDGTLDPSTVQIVGTSNPGDPLVVPGEGTWTVNTSTGEITFTPEVGFTADPTPIDYTVNDNDGNTSNTATVTVGYDAQPPLAVDDSSLGNTTGSSVVVDVLSNDSDPDGTLDPSTVQIVGTSNPGDPLVVPGEGTWTVNTSTGEITFTPEVGFTADPTPIDYTVNDNDGNTSNTATVTVGYDAQPPLAVDDSSLGNTTGSSVVVDVLSNDSDPDGTLDPSTVQIVGTSNPGDPLVVPGEGTWTVNTSTGEITFTPEVGFTADPTPIDYTVNDNDGNTSNTATVTVGYLITCADVLAGNVDLVDLFLNDPTNLIFAEDCDGDGTTNGDEVSGGTDPLDPCEDDGVTGDEDVSNPIWAGADCDGDGVINGDETIDGTDPYDPCEYDPASVTGPQGGDWDMADCDGDGETNDTDPDPFDPCQGGDLANVDLTDTVSDWYLADCDGDGVPNGIELDPDMDGNLGPNDTDPYDPCDFNITSQDLTTVSDPYLSVDCDGDGVTNGDEIDSNTDPNDPCSYFAADITLPVTTNTVCTPSLRVVKTAELLGDQVGDNIVYTITVQNTGNVTLTMVEPVDTLSYLNGPVIGNPQLTFVSADMNSAEGTLLPNEIATYTFTYTIDTAAFNAGGLSNTVTATGFGTNDLQLVEDVSDDGDNLDGNTTNDPTIVSLGCLTIFNEFSPNGDGVNDTFVINCIENYPNNTLEIYNRWGNIVYSKQGYDNSFTGRSNGRAVLMEEELLPVGTYYYVLNLGDGSEALVGWLYINR